MIRFFTLTSLLVCLSGAASAQWTSTLLPTSREDFATAATENRLYVAGGRFGGARDVVEVLELATKTWMTERLSVPRYYVTGAALGDEIFFAGGLTSSGIANVTSVVDIYNESTSSWATSQLPIPVFQSCAAALDDRVFFAGGRGSGLDVMVIQIFDTISRTWSVERRPGPVRSFMKSDQDDRWIVWGGGGGVGPGERIIDIYDAVRDTWQQVRAPIGVTDLVLNRGVIQVVDCEPGGGEQFIYEYQIERSVWTARATPTGRCGMSLGSIGPFTVLAGGAPFGSMWPVRSAYVFNSLTNEIEEVPLPFALFSRVTQRHEASGSLFFIGGRTPGNGTPSRQIDIFRPEPSIGTVGCSPSATNSTGSHATIEAAGLTLSRDNWFSIGMANGPPGSFAMFLAADDQGSATTPPGSEGDLCLGGTVVRLPETLGRIRQGGDHGAMVNLTLPDSPLLAIGIGSTWHFQGWYRDANPGVTSNFTEMLSVAFN